MVFTWLRRLYSRQTVSSLKSRAGLLSMDQKYPLKKMASPVEKSTMTNP